jgi:Flp pilus assembly protein TadG
MSFKPRERGQALILIAFGVIAIVSLVGMAIDGAHAFSDRRQAQNAVDAAALAAAIARVRSQNYRDAAIYQIKNNGYLNASSQVEVFQPPTEGTYSCAIRPDCDNFIQVKLKSTITTWFASIVGINTITNEVSATAQADKSSRVPFYGGAAIVALNKTNCRALEFNGHSTVQIKGSGMYVNSSCDNQPVTNPQKAFYSGGNDSVNAPWIKVVGGAYYSTGDLNLDAPIAIGSPSLQDIKDEYDLPAPVCSGAGMVDPLHPEVAMPGAYADFPPDGVTSMAPGIYCLDSFKIHKDLTGVDVTIVLYGGVNMDANANITLKAKETGEFAGLLMYMPPSHMQQITINGTSASEFSGLILAPGSHVTIAGTGKTGKFIGQVVADTVTFAGDGSLTIDYNEDKIYKPFTHGRVELVR